jgi:histidinol dehydrogenase
MTPAAARASLPHVLTFARVEGLDAHGRSLEIRTRSL